VHSGGRLRGPKLLVKNDVEKLRLLGANLRCFLRLEVACLPARWFFCHLLSPYHLYSTRVITVPSIRETQWGKMIS
jgi:hypothetical protein